MMGYEERDVTKMLRAVEYMMLEGGLFKTSIIYRDLEMTKDFLEGLLEEGRV